MGGCAPRKGPTGPNALSSLQTGTPCATLVGHVQELRAMVLRGAHEHPGAVAVEDEQGRMLNLAKLSLQVRRGCLVPGCVRL